MQHLQKTRRGSASSLRHFRVAFSRCRVPEGRYQTDGNQEAAVVPPHYFKPGEILRAAAGCGSYRIASEELRDFRSQIPRLKRNLRRRAAYAYRKLPMLARFQWRGVGFQIEPDKRH